MLALAVLVVKSIKHKFVVEWTPRQLKCFVIQLGAGNVRNSILVARGPDKL